MFFTHVLIGPPFVCFFFSSRRRHTRSLCDWSSDVCSSDLSPDEPYDFVACSATLHHMDTEAGLARLRELTALGGTLVIVGLAYDTTAWDRLIHFATRVPIRLARARNGWFNHGGSVANATQSWSAMRGYVAAALPGAQFRRRLYWRYSVVWERPSS